MIARRAGSALALVAVILLVIAEFSAVVEVTVGGLEVVVRSTSGGENHGYALLVVAVVAVAMTPAALRGARAPALALVALGLAALAVCLAVDLPDTRRSGGLPESLAYEEARARPATGFGLQLAGGVLLTAAGGLLLAGAGGAGHAARAGGGTAQGSRERRR